jgi:hypothetical protein
MGRVFLIVLVMGVFGAGERLRGADFALGFEGCPAEVLGAPGEVKRFESFVTLSTTSNDSPDGAAGWAFAVGARGGQIADLSIEGIVVSTRFHLDQGSTLDPFLMDLAEAYEKTCGISPGACESISGYSVVALDRDLKKVLQPNGTQRIARITVEAVVPSEAEAEPLILSLDQELLGCEDGRIVLLGGERLVPSAESRTIPFGRPRFRRGDVNSDGAFDISDPIADLGFLFLGHEGPGCRDAADANDDGSLDISDALFLLDCLFGDRDGWSIPAPGPYACGQDPDPRPGSCESSRPCPGAALGSS